MNQHWRIVWLAAAALGGCGATGQLPVDYAIAGAGEGSVPFAAGDWQVTLTEARVGIGPVYFCATAGASSDLCPTAVQEFADTATVDALREVDQDLGRVTGTTGEIRSATYDYAVNWFTTQRQPSPASGAPDGHSARFAGMATRGGRTVRFTADVDVVSRIQGERAVQGAAAIQSFDVAPPEGFRLVVRMRPSQWWSGVDFEEIAALAVEPGDGSAATVVVPQDSRAMSAITLGMTAGVRPEFDWQLP